MNDHLRASDLFLRALALPPAERGAFLETACEGDAALRARVDEMLALDARSSGTEAMAGRVRRAAAKASETARRPPLPERIGPYRVLELLGEGGMGVVYRAEQIEPIRREVALKLIRWGADSAVVVARFEAERQILASMNHPNIARVFDAGTDDEGRPYFAMERIDGIPITDYCRSRKLGASARLRLFLDVCRGVRHAHRRGVIHRDLKPSNVLVTEAGGAPVPKVIDFSIAKALEMPALLAEFRTRTGQLVGTLEYMSPEQARGDIAAVDTRADVWALGVILHELLAEGLPFDLEGQPVHEAVRRLSDEPPRPLRATATTATGRIDGDVATIVGKCLEKDPDRRYGSAADLCDDVERYLSSWPIAARPPSTMYQLRKLAGRHRVAFGVLALVLSFLIVFSVTLSVQLGIQRRERLRAEAEARKAESVRDFLVGMLTAARGDREGNDVTVMQALDVAARDVEASFAHELDVGVAVRSAIASSYEGLESLDRTEALRQRNVELLEAAHGPDDPRLATALRELAAALSRQMRSDEAEARARRALAIHEQAGPSYALEAARDAGVLGLVLLDRFQLDESEKLLRRQIDVLERSAAADPSLELELAAARQSLARFLLESGRPGDIQGIVREVLAAKRRHDAARGEPTLAVATSLCDLAALVDANEAEALWREALEIQRRRASASPSIAAGTMIGLGRTLGELGRYREAESIMRDALDVFRRNGATRTPEGVGALMNFSVILSWGGHPREGAVIAHEALSIGSELLDPGDPWITDMKMLEGDALGRMGRFDQGEALLREAVATADATLTPDHPQRASSRVLLAMLLERRGRPADALPLVDEALAIYGRYPGGGVHHRVPYALQTRALVLDELGRRAEAEPVHDEALRAARSAGERHFLVATILHDRARCLLDSGRPREAADPARQALEIRQQLLGNPHPDTAASHALMASIESTLGHPVTARALASAALEAFAGLDYAVPALVSEAQALAGEPSPNGP